MEKEKSFEQKLKRLQEIVENLKEGELSLEQSLQVFEEGSKLSSDLEKKLNEAEEKAKKIKEGEKNS